MRVRFGPDERLLANQPSDDNGYLFRSRTRRRPHISARQYARIVHRWINTIGLDDRGFGTHSLRRTKVAQLYRKTGNLSAVQLLLGHAKIETTVRYLGVELGLSIPWGAVSIRVMTTLRPNALMGNSRKRNLFAHVADELGGRIVRGEIEPGAPFPIEAELGEEFGASRSVIREAVKSLAAKGLLESRTRTGIKVLPPERWNLFDLDVLEWRYMSMQPGEFFRELFEIRRMIEPEAAALAAERATPTEIASIQTAFEAMETSQTTTDEAIAADLLFHRSILAAGHNALLLQMGSLIGVGLLVSYRISKDPFTVFLNMHKDVLTAIKARNAKAARKAMDMLLTGTRDYLEEHLPKSRRRAAT